MSTPVGREATVDYVNDGSIQDDNRDTCIDRFTQYVGGFLKGAANAAITQYATPAGTAIASPAVDRSIDACTKSTANIAKASLKKSKDACILS